MHPDHDDNIPAGPEAPEDQAREVVEAMHAAGTLTPATEQAILAAGRRHARFLARAENKLDSEQQVRSL